VQWSRYLRSDGHYTIPTTGEQEEGAVKFNELRVQDPATKTYLGSPSIVRLPSGDLLATHDYFGPGCPRNHEGEEHLTSVYRSEDDGRRWRNVTHIANAFWSSLFVLAGAVYLIGTTQQYGSIVIRRSEDGGFTWTHPVDRHSGLLHAGGPRRLAPNYHCAPVPVLVRGGRIYRAFEDNQSGVWPSGFQACVLSADARADLLDASSWRMSDKLAFRAEWLSEDRGSYVEGGWLEGNVVEDREGQLWNVLRLNARRPGDQAWSLWNKAAMVHIEEAGTCLSFDPAEGLIDLPGGHSKFTIRYDNESERYLTLSNGVSDLSQPSLRSVLSMYASTGLRSWSYCLTLLADDSGLSPERSAQRTGFQYADWQFDGEDIIYLVRTAYGGAHTYHDANRITFHRLRGFRQWLAL